MDVCPFVPVRGVTMDDCVICANKFGKKMAEELNVPGPDFCCIVLRLLRSVSPSSKRKASCCGSKQ